MDLTNNGDQPQTGRQNIPTGGATVVFGSDAHGGRDCVECSIKSENTQEMATESRLVVPPGDRESCAESSFACCDLYQAMVDDDVRRMTEILASGDVDVNAMFHFSHNDRKRLSERLLSMNVGQCMPEYAALHVCCVCNNVRMLDTLLKHSPDLDTLATTGESALHMACKYGHVTCVQRLLQCGATVNIRSDDASEDTPLKTAVTCFTLTDSDTARNTYLHIVKELLEHGTDVNMIDAAAGCDVNAASRSGYSPLYVSVQDNNLTAVLDLLQAGADPRRYVKEWCPAILATINRQLVVLLLFLLHGAAVNTRDSFSGATLLLIAARKASVAGVCMLLRWGANPNLDHRLGTCPLWAAVKIRNVQLVSILLQTNCDLELLSLEMSPYRPLTPLQLALELRHLHIARLLLLAGSQCKPSWVRPATRGPGLEHNRVAVRWIERWVKNPCRLDALCRQRIRGAIGLHIAEKLCCINYPQRLKDYILLKDIAFIRRFTLPT
ncbi:hypothetical protein NP493_195g04033 [Ridgeia piscesae]|uniref:SOCS box domain-containing protein n=1 Tax=Ridgeia piscesae TaxID=27915 RepID=A0AAD9P1U8_RIDPI|nr:hypothetical protein NP493_195g04033 [Ridgeia piscesae]